MTRLPAAALTIAALALMASANAQSTAPNAMDTGNLTNPRSTVSTEQALAHQIADLPWLIGPQTIPVGDNATIAIPTGYEMLSPPDSLKFLQLNGNPIAPDDNASYILQNTDPNSAWFAILAYDPTGHIADNTTIDPAAILTQMQTLNNQDNTARQKHGQPPMALNGWAIPPTYTQPTHTLQWAYDFTNPDNTHTINLQERILSRTGNLKIIIVDAPNELKTDIPDITKSLTGFAFNESQRYDDYQPSDPPAPITLTTLITGASATSPSPSPPPPANPNKTAKISIATLIALTLTASAWWLLKKQK